MKFLSFFLILLVSSPVPFAYGGDAIELAQVVTSRRESSLDRLDPDLIDFLISCEGIALLRKTACLNRAESDAYREYCEKAYRGRISGCTAREEAAAQSEATERIQDDEDQCPIGEESCVRKLDTDQDDRYDSPFDVDTNPDSISDNDSWPSGIGIYQCAEQAHRRHKLCLLRGGSRDSCNRRHTDSLSDCRRRNSR